MAKRRKKRRKKAPPKAQKQSTTAREQSDIGNQVDVIAVETEPIAVRRWDSAATSRLNKAHWAKAHGNSINEDLSADLETLRARSTHEAANNPMVEGVINTHQIDVVGQEGPTLQVQSDSTQYNDAIEKWWEVVFEKPDPNSDIHGAEMIRSWIGQFWKSGEYLNEEVTHRRSGPTQLGIATYHPRRLQTPPDFVGDPQVAFGIRFDDFDKPTQYYIRRNANRGLGSLGEVDRYEPVPADMIQHVFPHAEPDQIRGFPWLSSALGTISDLRQFDQHVMESAKQSAANPVYHYTESPDALYVNDLPETDIVEPGVRTWMPPHWRTESLQSTQPNAQYREYRHEKLRDLGRPAGMPLMVVLLSSADSNFSSAHYDAQVYMRAIEWLQSFISRRSLVPYVRSMSREVSLALRLVIPTKVKFKFTWPKPPYVNPKQMYDALSQQLEDGACSMSDVMAMYGRNEESVIASRKTYIDRLKAAGLPDPPVNHGGNKSPDVLQQEADAKTKTSENSKSPRRAPVARPNNVVA